MKQVLVALAFLLVGMAISSCTTARWTVKDRQAMDSSEYEVTGENIFLSATEEVTPDDPVFTLDLHAERTYRYNQRVQVQRTIQDYRPQPVFTVLGIAGAALSFYTANASALTQSRSSAQYYTLTTAGSLMALSGILNMKPTGEPRPTGEERLLRTSGDSIRVDTVGIQQSVPSEADIELTYKDSLVFSEEGQTVSSGKLSWPLADKLDDLQISGADPGTVGIKVTFEDSTYAYELPVSSVLEPYARITSPLTELRNTPSRNSDNILADLMNESLIRVQNFDNEEWYTVLYGISENYIRKEDAELMWRASGSAGESEVLSMPRIPFGDIDVESNIPVIRGRSLHSIALIVSNEGYPAEQSRTYAHRDGALIQSYLETALGYSQEQIFTLEDIESSAELNRVIEQIEPLASDSTELFIYLNGHGVIHPDTAGHRLSLLSVTEDSASTKVIPLQPILEELSAIPADQKILLQEIDFSSSYSDNGISQLEIRDLLEEEASSFAEQEKAAILMGMRLNQPSGLYISAKGEDKKHHIFPYYFAKALQQRITGLSDIYQYLQRNVPYTSRKLHDRSQDPILLGNTTLDLSGE